MKVTAITLFFLALSAVAAYLYLSPHRDGNADDIVIFQTDASDKKIADLIQENEAYKNKIQMLENTNQHLLAQLRHEANVPQASASSEASSNSNSAQHANSFSEELRRQRLAEETAREVTAYLDKFNSQDTGEINRDLKKKFETEAIDYLWADNYERKLEQLFTNDKNLLEFVPEGIICKTTRCQIKVPISSFEESNQVMDAISQALQGDLTGLGESMVITIPDPSVGFVDFYIARNKSTKLYQ